MGASEICASMRFEERRTTVVGIDVFVSIFSAARAQRNPVHGGHARTTIHARTHNSHSSPMFMRVYVV